MDLPVKGDWKTAALDRLMKVMSNNVSTNLWKVIRTTEYIILR